MAIIDADPALRALDATLHTALGGGFYQYFVVFAKAFLGALGLHVM